MSAPEQDESQDWVSPVIRCEFGPYFKSDADEDLKAVTMVQTALGAGKPPGVKLLTQRQGLEQIAPIFGIENVDAAMGALEEEQAAADKKKADEAAAAADNAVKIAKAKPEPIVQGQAKQPVADE